MEVYEKGKSRLVSIDILKEFRGDNNTHGFSSEPPPLYSIGRRQMREIRNLINKPTDMNLNPAAATNIDTGLVQYNGDSRDVNPTL